MAGERGDKMGVSVFEVKYKANKIGMNDGDIANVVWKHFIPNDSSTVVYSISEEEIEETLEKIDDKKERAVLEALLKRAKEFGGSFDLSWY